MPKVRRDISNQQVLDLYERFDRNKSSVARYLDCSIRLVFEVIEGVRQDPGRPKPPAQGREICTCCGQNPKGKGKRFLCDDCFSNGGPSIADEHTCGLKNAIMF